MVVDVNIVRQRLTASRLLPTPILARLSACRGQGSSYEKVRLDDEGLSWQYPAKGLQGATNYCFRARAGNQYNFSTWSAPACNQTLHGVAPTATDAPTLQAWDGKTLQLAPGAIDDEGGSPILSVDCAVRGCKQTGVGVPLSCDTATYPASPQGLCLVPDATESTLFRIQTIASNQWGAGNASEPITCILLPGQPLFCNREDRSSSPAVTHIAVSSVGSDRARLVWTAPASDQGDPTSFEVQRDDWWSGASFATVGTANESESYIVTGLLPASVYHFRVRGVSRAGSTGEWSEVVAATTADAGACGDRVNLPAQKAHFSTLKHTVQFCLLTALGNANRAASCITNKVGFTEACAMCWVHEGQCAAGRCAGSCLENPAGKACEDCAIDKCFPPLLECTGLPISTCPM